MLEFHADHRTNGLTHVTVKHEGQEAGGFTLTTEAFHTHAQSLRKAGAVHQTEHGAPVFLPASPTRTRRRQSAPPAAEPETTRGEQTR